MFTLFLVAINVGVLVLGLVNGKEKKSGDDGPDDFIPCCLCARNARVVCGRDERTSSRPH